jgi:hypothetical protein
MWKPGFWNFGICSFISKSVLQPLECMFVHTDYRTEIVKLRLKYITSYGSWCIFIYDPLNGKWVQERWKVKSFCRVECFWWKLVVGNLLSCLLFHKSISNGALSLLQKYVRVSFWFLQMYTHVWPSTYTQKDHAAQFSAPSSVCLSVTRTSFALSSLQQKSCYCTQHIEKTTE